MKFLYYIIFMILITPLVKAGVKEDILKTNKRIDSINLVNQSIAKRYDNLITANANQNNQIDFSEKLLNGYDNLNNYLFAIIAIVFAIFGLVGYIGIYKPAREELKEVRSALKEAQELQLKIKENMNTLFSEYFNNYIKELIDDILENIFNDTKEALNKIGQLGMYQYEKFNDVQIQKMIEIVKKNNRYSASISQILSNSYNIHTEIFFSKCIKDPLLDENNITAVLYFTKYDKTEYLDDIAEYIVRTHSIINASFVIRNYSIDFLIKLFNNDVLIKGISAFALQSLNNAGIFNDVIIQNTKLYKKHVERGV